MNKYNSNDELAQTIIKRFSGLKANRSIWEQQYQEIDELVAPSPNRFNSNQPTPGIKVNQKVFDVTATQALNRFIAAMSSTLTPRSQRWHRLSVAKSYQENKEIQIYLDQVTDILFNVRYNPKGNFASQIDECYRSLGKFGTACMFVDDELGKGIRYKAIHLSEIYVSENAVGIVDTVYRKFQYTARQAIEAFGEDNMPDKILQANENNPDLQFWFIHAVYPNKEHDESKYDSFKFKSCYICEDCKVVVSEGGYRTMPYAASRYITEPGEMYGRSPAMDVLPEIKTLNRARKANLRNLEKLADPPILAHEDAAESGLNMQAGSINFGMVDSDGRPLAIPFNSGARIDLTVEEINQMRQMINEAFLVTLFQILVESPQMTATEVQYRQQEKGEMLAPTMGRQQSELIAPIIERELDILSAAGVLPPMPDALLELGGVIEIEYEAPLNKIMRSSEATSILQTLQTAAGLAQFDPIAIKKLKIPEAIDIIADIWGVPADIIRSNEEIAQMEAAAAQQQQLQQLLQAAPIVSQSVKNIADAQEASTAAGPGVGLFGQ